MRTASGLFLAISLILTAFPGVASTLKDYRGDYQVVFFLLSTCPYCAHMVPTLDDVYENYGIDILPVSLDGMPVPHSGQWKAKTIPDNGNYSYFMPVEVTPTFYVINNKTMNASMFAAGIIPKEEFLNSLVSTLKSLEVVPYSLSNQALLSTPQPAQSNTSNNVEQNLASDLRNSLRQKYFSIE